MPTLQPEYKNRSRQYTSVSSAVNFAPPIAWIQVLGSGDVTLKDEAGTAVTFTGCLGGEVFEGPFSQLTSMTSNKVRLGDGHPPESAPAAINAVRVPYDDSGSKTLKTETGGALDEIYAGLLSNQRTIPLTAPHACLDAVTGAPLLVFANSSNALPGSYAVAKSTAARWNNHAAPTPIETTFAMPQDLDDTQNVVYHGLVAKTGATLGDATTLTVQAFEQVVGALYDADTDFGGASSAVVGDATAKTITEVTCTFTAANIHAAPSGVTLLIAPTAGTLGTDDFLLIAHWIEITPVLLPT